MLEHAHFVHAYVRVCFGAATCATLPDSAALVVRHSSFTQYAEHSTLYIVDEQQALANVTRGGAQLKNNTFAQSGAANCSIWMQLASDNDDDAQPYRVILARNRFENNELVGAAGVLSLSASSASLHLLDNDFAGNNASSLLRCVGDASSNAH